MNYRLVWIGVLLAPAAWLIQFQTNYVLVEWACSHQQNLTPLHIVSVVFLLIAAVSGLVSWRNWQASDAPHTRFLSMVGVLMSTLFFLTIIAQAIPMFILSPCIQ